MVPSFVTMAVAPITLTRRALAAVGILAIVAYLAAIAYLVTQETAIIFSPGRPLGELRPKTPFEQVWVDGTKGPRQLAWIMRTATESDTRPWVIFLHGNDSNIATRTNILHYERLWKLGLNVIAPEYRGFGGVEGVPSEAGLNADARVSYDYLRQQLRVEPRRIVIYGWSLGSAVAVDLASNVEEAALILEGAPASLVAIGQRRYPYFPIRLLIRNPFESILKIAKVGTPVLFLHSPEDVIIPIEEGRRLFDAAPPPKQFVEVSGGHVYAAERDPGFFTAVRTFLQSHRLLP
jgi:pimeloyl-ACP methyl ester carboxylesterase